MSNYSKLLSLGIPITKTSGTDKTLCPKCSASRKNKKEKCLSINIDEGIFNCHNCGYKGSTKIKREQEKKYFKPTWENHTELSAKLVKWFADRGISQNTLIDLKITEGEEYMPQTQTTRNCIKFNYFRNDELINIKFRDGAKNFKLVKDAELILYNLDSADKSIVICEGEIDCLSFIEAGIKSVCSVPNGASKTNLAYLDNCYEKLETIDTFYIAVDTDEAGMLLREELIRRLGAEKCFVIDLKDCKDANEFLIKYGAIELSDIITNARPCEINGIIQASYLISELIDLYERGLPTGDKIGMKDFDDLLSFVSGQLTVITGVPNHGKSDFLDQVCLCLAVKHKWKFGVFSPENFPIQLHLSKLAEKLIGKSFKAVSDFGVRMNLPEVKSALNFIDEHFFFIQPSDEDLSIDSILNHARKLVKRYGIKGLIIDPWNKLDHQYNGNETQYISQSLDLITKFNHKNGVHTFLIAHPVKLQKDRITGEIEIPNLYQISGSAHFYNKSDNGIVVHRFFSADPIERRTEIHIQKVKFRHLGMQGMASTNYDMNNGRFNSRNEMSLDKSNWLYENKIIPTIQYQSTIPIENNTFTISTNNNEEYPF